MCGGTGHRQPACPNCPRCLPIEANASRLSNSDQSKGGNEKKASACRLFVRIALTMWIIFVSDKTGIVALTFMFVFAKYKYLLFRSCSLLSCEMFE
jgi:hypothetical protein